LFGLKSKKQDKQKGNTPDIDRNSVVFAITDYQLYISNNIKETVISNEIKKQKPELDSKKIDKILDKELFHINNWLKSQFNKLNNGIPKHKRIGIHMISIVWGAAILTVEFFIGGGITALEMALDSVLAPYVTAGATEIFIINELKSIVKELQQRYMDALNMVLDLQHENYKKIVEDLKPVSSKHLPAGLVMI